MVFTLLARYFPSSEGRPVAPELSRARLAACDAVRKVLALNLRLIGVSAPEKM